MRGASGGSGEYVGVPTAPAAWLKGGVSSSSSSSIGCDEDGDRRDGAIQAIVMVNYYAPGSLSVSDYDVYTLKERGAISVSSLKQRFHLVSVWLLDGQELHEDPSGCTEVRALLNMCGDLDVTGVPVGWCCLMARHDEENESAAACVLQ